MQITVFGANGRVGSIVVKLALDRGYAVQAFVHKNSNLANDQNLKIIKGDIYNLSDVKKAIKGSDVVISCLSSWGTPKKNILCSAISNIIPAMEDAKIKRLVSLTGADARAANDNLSIMHRLSHVIIKIIGRKVIEDAEKQIKLLEDSSLDYTVLRSPIMNDNGKVEYVLSDKRPLPWATVNRRAVSLAMLKLVSDQTNAGQSPFISR
jgi:putative NADH-flavin reductase